MKNKIFSLLLAFAAVLVLVGCSNNNKENKVTYTDPSITNDTQVVYSGTYNNRTFDVTKGDVYDQIRYYGGLSLLLEQIDKELLSSTISEITTTDKFYQSRYNRMVYETSSQATIDSYTQEEKAHMLDDYNQTMKLMGLDEAGAEAYIKLLAARDKAAYNFIKAEYTNPKSDYYLSNSALETYYKNSYNNTAKALVINYANASDFRNALKTVNLVVYNSELRKYTGTTPIADVTRTDLSDENTTAVSDNEVLGLFVELYNAQCPYKTAITTDSAINNAEFAFTYETLKNHASSLASFIFSMEKDEYTYTTYKSKTDFGTEYSLIYKLDDAKKEFANLTEAELEEVKDAYLMEQAESSTVSKAALTQIRSDAHLTINDKYFAYTYASSYDSSMKWKGIKGDSSIIAKADGVEITADSYYDYAMGHNDALYILYASIMNIEECINNFEMVYGSERDLTKNTSLRKNYYTEQLNSALASYSEDTYESQNVYLYARYGYNTFDKVLLNHFVASDLKTIWVSENVLVNTDGVYSFSSDASTYATDVLNSQYTNYYNLYSYQINVTTDYNNDFVADDLLDVYQNTANYNITLTQAEIENKLADLYTIIAQKLDGKHDHDVAETLTDFVKEYNKNEDGTYTQFKAMGFKVSYEKVTSSNTAITYYNYGDTATDEMNAQYKSIYTTKMLANTFSEFALSDTFVADKNGAHFICATEGTDTLKAPSFKYEFVEGDDEKYNAQAANDNDEPTLSQFAAAFNIYYYSLLAADKDEAKDKFGIENYPLPFPTKVSFTNYTKLLSNYFFSDNYLYMMASNVLKDATTDATLKTKFETISTVYSHFLEENK